MKDISCGVVRDLLVLYVDDVCSKESRQMIENHIAECDECREQLKKVENADKNPSDDVSKKVNSEIQSFVTSIKKMNKKILIRNILIAVIAISFIVISELANTDFFYHAISSENIEVAELYELKNGDIYCTLKSKKDFSITSPSYIIVPTSKWEEDYDQGIQKITFRDSLFTSAVKINTESIVFPRTVKYPNSEDEDTVPHTHTSASIYYEGKNKNDRLLIWETDQDILPAPQEIEKKVIAQYYQEGLDPDVDHTVYPLTIDSLDEE